MMMDHLDLTRPGNYHLHHDYNSVRNDNFSQHHHSQLAQHRHHPYPNILDAQQQQQHRFSSQSAATAVQYHPNPNSSEMASVVFDAEQCAREIVSSPLSSTGSSSTANNGTLCEEHHSTGIPPMTAATSVADSQP